MDNSEHASVDIKKLADTLRGGFETLYPLSQDCCIYRVPRDKLRLNPIAYTPQVVSIGPIHHGKEDLKAMEENKTRYLQHFFQRTKVSIEQFLAFIKKKEAKLRSCYAETIELESDEFVRMILVDAVFLLELFLRGYNHHFATNDDRIFRKPKKINRLCPELWLLENQLPLFILNDLFNLAKTATHDDHYEGLSLITISDWVRKNVLHFFSIEENLLEINFSKAEHFLDLLRLCLKPSHSGTRTQFKAQNIPSAMELHQAGVKFKLGASKNLLDITFNKGVLEIPSLSVYDSTQRFYQKMLAFEDMHGYSRYFNDYIIMMSYLVNTAKDAELLIQNEIIGLKIGNSEKLSTVFHNLNKDYLLDPTFQYSGLVEDLQTFCKYPFHRWKAILKQNYFNSPWASISVVAAVILLLLAFIQAACSIMALYL